MASTHHWTSMPNGMNRPKAISKKPRSSYNQNDPLGDPELAKALDSKMQAPEGRFNQHMTVEDVVNALPRGHAEYTSVRISNNIRDAQAVIRQLPDISLAANIVVSAIMTSGLQSTAISYESNLETTLPGLTRPLLDKISLHIEDTFNLKKTLPKWIHDALILEGAKPIMILPESSIDYVINGAKAPGLEDYRKEFRGVTNASFNILGNGSGELDRDTAHGAGLNTFNPNAADETKYNDAYQRFSDNPSSLRLSGLRTKRVKDRLAEAYLQHMPNFAGYRVAGLNDDGDKENPFAAAIRDQQTGKVTLKNSYYTDRSYKVTPVEMIRDPSTLDRPNIGHPVHMVLPMESVVPIFDPADPSVHVAYYVALDENHRPISMLSSASKNLQGDYTGFASNDDLPSMFIRQADTAMSMEAKGNSGASKESKYLDYDAAFELYTTVVWNDWAKRLENGILGTSYHMSKPEGLMRLLFEMTLRKKRTQIVLVPAQLMTYFAYNYDDVGVGESLIEMSKTLASLRLVLLYSQTNMEFQSSIPRRRLNMQIDPREPDKNQAVKMLYQNWILNQQTVMPINVIDPVQLNQSVWRQAVEVNIESDPRFPNTKLEVDTIQFDKREADPVLTDRLQKHHNMGFGLTPEQIDSSLGDDRVTSRLLNNEMFRQRVTVWKDLTDFHLTDLVQKYVLSSGPLMDDIRGTISANKEKIATSIEGKTVAIDVDRLAVNFVTGISVALPNVEEEGLEDTEEKFEKYDGFVEKVLGTMFDEQVWQSGGENARLEDIRLLRSMLKAVLVQDWLRERGVLPDIADLMKETSPDKSVNPMVDRALSFMEKMAPIITKATEKLRAINDTMNVVVPARGGEIGQEAGSYDDGDEGGGDDDFGGGFDDFGDDGDDGLSSSPDEGMDETPDPEQGEDNPEDNQ